MSPYYLALVPVGIFLAWANYHVYINKDWKNSYWMLAVAITDTWILFALTYWGLAGLGK